LLYQLFCILFVICVACWWCCCGRGCCHRVLAVSSVIC